MLTMFENAMHCGPCIAAGICMPVADRNGRPAFLSAPTGMGAQHSCRRQFLPKHGRMKAREFHTPQMIIFF